MEVHLSDFSSGNIMASVVKKTADVFQVDIPEYNLHLILSKNNEEWKFVSNTGIYNPAWLKEIVYQIIHDN